MSELTDLEYEVFVTWLSDFTAHELREAKGDPPQQAKTLYRYYRCGEKAGLSASELIDFLAVNTPSILDMAGYTEEEADALIQISDNLDLD